ncbi:MAG: hypothetical protein IJ537_00340 [Bacteroidaceae bacterium]|nr:hypothetical protein [Bacteroidaceae bacterium]
MLTTTWKKHRQGANIYEGKIIRRSVHDHECGSFCRHESSAHGWNGMRQRDWKSDASTKIGGQGSAALLPLASRSRLPPGFVPHSSAHHGRQLVP